MGNIISSRIRDDRKVVFEVAVDYDEAKQLQGHMDKIHLFSLHNSQLEANLSQRGKNEATKYFLIPRQLRDELKFNGKVQCQRIESASKIMFIYMVDKSEF
ncbi:hypothetical protein GF345_05840 [Candidatus Woesearchaeota archaeon]|nr:hypothetical protein [Candidatus Woesearchaeota archaeon]